MAIFKNSTWVVLDTKTKRIIRSIDTRDNSAFEYLKINDLEFKYNLN